MRQITIIEEGNVAERYPIGGGGFTCMSSVWVFDGNWDTFTETESPDLKRYATKLIGPVSGKITSELAKNLAEMLRRMGFDVITTDTLDD